MPHTPDSSRPESGRPRAQTPWQTLGGRVISLISRKGGVGKTTSAVNIGAALALSGHTVLIIGVDPQCGVCRSLGTTPDALPVSLTDLFDCGERLADLVQPSPLQGLHYVSPRVLTLEDEESFFTTLEERTGEFVREVDRARALYDTILIDCPPSLGPATRAALLASDSYLVPVQAEELCRESLGSLLEFVDEFRARNFLHPEATPDQPSARLDDAPLTLEGLFLTMANGRTRMGRHVAAKVSEEFGEVLLESSVPRTTRLTEMALRGKPAVIYDRRSAGSRAYFDLADELVSRYCQSQDTEVSAPFAAISEAMVSAGEREEIAEALAPPAGEDSALSGVDRFLSELVGPDPAPMERSEEISAPEMVSLDDLLAEEERPAARGDDDWDEGYWSRESDSGDRVN